MTPEELREEWEAGDEMGMRPKRVQAVRDDLADVTGVPIPYRIHEIEVFVDHFRGTITRELRRATGEYDDD